MESAGLRRRDQRLREATSKLPTRSTPRTEDPSLDDPSAIFSRLSHGAPRGGYQPPKFTVDLSLPPEDRYAHIAPNLTDQINNSNLPALFDDLVSSVAGPRVARCLHLLARLGLRRVYSSEETRELQGISRVTAVPMHLLVAFNVLLDLLLGCTSGGVRVEERSKTEGGGPKGEGSDGIVAGSAPGSRILHFRTLDWGMDSLRKLVVELDFVRRTDGPVVATSLTYFGYVGVLTGVRPGLSMSLNFRPYHDRSTRWKRVSFRCQQMMVVLGLRPSISSVLRAYLLGGRNDDRLQSIDGAEIIQARRHPETSDGVNMKRIIDELASSPSTAAYLIFCTPQHVYSLEKDNRKASFRDSAAFLTTYNHDAADEASPSHFPPAVEQEQNINDAIGMSDLITYSMDRKKHVDRIWAGRIRRRDRRVKRQTDSVSAKDVLDMVCHEEVSNEETHYAVVMDPQSGQILWRRVYEVDGDAAVLD